MFNFVHLHLHDEFSLLDGIGTPEQYCKKAKELNYSVIGVTNHGNIDSFVQFHKAGKKYGIKIIYGVETYIVPDLNVKEKGEKRGHLTIWIKDDIGYKNVLQMMSIANLYGFYYRPRIDYDLLLKHQNGLCIGTACINSFIYCDGGIDFLKKLMKANKDIYIELMPFNSEKQIVHNNKCLELSEELKLPIICTNDVHFIEKEHKESHEVLLCIQSKDKMKNPDRWRFDVDGLFFCSPDYIYNAFVEQQVLTEEEIKQGMANTIEIADKCEFEIKQKEITLPIPPQYKGMNEEDVLIDLCERGFEKRFGVKIDLRGYL